MLWLNTVPARGIVCHEDENEDTSLQLWLRLSLFPPLGDYVTKTKWTLLALSTTAHLHTNMYEKHVKCEIVYSLQSCISRQSHNCAFLVYVHVYIYFSCMPLFALLMSRRTHVCFCISYVLRKCVCVCVYVGAAPSAALFINTSVGLTVHSGRQRESLKTAWDRGLIKNHF